jgi:FkbM family methyltransferase
MNATVQYKGKDVFFMDVNKDDHIENKLIRGEWYELANLQFIRDLQVKGNYVDVGAYIGTHSIFFSLFCPVSTIYSFEPQKDSFNKLLKNLNANQITNCIPFNSALLKKAGRGLASGTYANRGGAPFSLSDDQDAVPAIPLDYLKLKNISLMKVDVEGAELGVLQGAKETLKQVKHLFIEIWSRPQCKLYNIPYLGDKVKTFLTKQGLEIQLQPFSDSIYYFKRIRK